MEHKISTEKKMRYVAKDFTTGLVDVTLNVRTPAGVLFDFGAGTDLILTEKWNGEYEGAYTPDALGVWQKLVTSATNGDKAVRSYIVVASDLADVVTELGVIESKVDVVDGKVDVVDGKIDVVDGKVDAVKGDTETIITKVDALDLEVSPGGYFSN